MPISQQRSERLRIAKSTLSASIATYTSVIEELTGSPHPGPPELPLTGDDDPLLLEIAKRREVLEAIVAILDGAIDQSEVALKPPLK